MMRDLAMTRPQTGEGIHSMDAWASIPGRLGVLQLLPNMAPNGLARAAVEAAAAVMAAGGRAVVASAGGPLVPELLRCGAVHELASFSGDGAFGRWASIRRLMRILHEHQIAIVHIREPGAAALARKAASMFGAWLVATCHGTHDDSTPAMQERNAAMAEADRLIAVSQTLAAYLRTQFPTQGREPLVIAPGLDLQRFDPSRVGAERIIQLAQQWSLPDGVPVIMLPGRLTRSHGQRALIEALARLGSRELHCVLVAEDSGNPGYRRELTRLAEQHGLTARLSIVDDCRDMPAAYMLADAVVYARPEGCGFARAAAEAQAMGRPLVAYDGPVLRDQTGGGRMTWLVPPDDRSALAAALADALELSAAEREALAPQSIAIARQRYNRADAAAATIELYLGLLIQAEAA
jgi:glycosyltransferase involved in cell wall biosynthesis